MINKVQWRFNVSVPIGLKFAPLIFDFYLYYIFKDEKINKIIPFYIAYTDDTTIKLKRENLNSL